MMKTLLICHERAELNKQGLARWLASFSNLVGIVVLRETKRQVWRHIQREMKRAGIIRFVDAVAFRIYYWLFLSKKDRIWQDEKLKELLNTYPEVPHGTPVLYTHSPNSPEAEQFIRKLSPEIMLARCKTLLKEQIFAIPAKGTFVMHPGICPEYRNAHGCFWALVNDDLDKVGMTLLQIDKGVDTGPVYGYYSYKYDEVNESHIVIQHRAVLENLDKLREELIKVHSGLATPLDTSGRPSAIWGQPWLTSYLKWKYKARRRNI
jgi:hypothetical protein